MSSNIPPNVQKAVDFFSTARLSRLLQKLRERYIELGRVGGQITLEDCTPDERRDIASFLGKPPYRDIRIKVKLAEFDSVLQQSGFACELPDLLNAFFPDQPLVTRPQQRAAHKVHQADFHTALLSIAMELPADSQGRKWLLHGQHGLDWLFSHYKNESIEEQERQLGTVRSVVSALDRLPASTAPERLALFAQRIGGDPHMFDPDRTSGRLLRYALEDIVSLSGESSLQVQGAPLDLYANSGLLLDTISSNVAVFHLAGAVYSGGSHDPLPQAAGTRVLLLPLRQLLEWLNVMSSSSDVYVFENPQVFEEVIAGLLCSNAGKGLPTLVCTSGWPSTAALMLLDLLVAQSPANHLHYSGDFDLAGLKIAAYLLERYPGRCSLWRFDPDSYLQASHDEGRLATKTELKGLKSLPEAFAPLVEIMQERGKWAYQEGIARLLLEDVIEAP
jgi:uncharacterized protein (TIGR02679 family)